jgi:transposase
MTVMKRFAGLDVSLSTTSICVVDGHGQIVFEGVATTDPDAIGAVLAPHGPDLVGLEAGPMSEWLHEGLSRHALETVLMETRHVRAALKASLIKTDRRDAYGIAQLLRMGWFRPVHVKTASARERRVLLGARDTLVRRLRDLDNSVRGLLRGFGLRPPRLLRGRWSGTVRQLIFAHPVLMAAIDPILVARDRLSEELARLDKLVRDQARDDAVCRRLMTVPGVGAVVALSYVAAIDDPARFARSKAVGPALGLTPSRYQSGATDRPGAITKAGDARARVALFEAAHVMMTPSPAGFP